MNLDNIFDTEESKSIRYEVYTIRMSDVEDPDLMVAAPIYDWKQTEAGKWVMEHSSPKPSWHKNIDHLTYGYQYKIVAYLTPKQLTYWKLKYE